MGKNPYSDLPKSAFWKTGVTQQDPFFLEGIYKKKFNIPATAKIATAGSCFAQHISRNLRKNGYKVLDFELAPLGLPPELHQKYGYAMYSARYGNIYTSRQLLQLMKEVIGDWIPTEYVWQRGDRFFDAFRPTIEPKGFPTPEEVIDQRRRHVQAVARLFRSMDVFIFTLGLTETWLNKNTGIVFPTAPGTVCGEFNDELFEFKNLTYSEIYNDIKQFLRLLDFFRGESRPKCRFILTVSPVPLTATASNSHVLAATIYSKSVLRSVAGFFAMGSKRFDYFPSYEIIMNPRTHSICFEENLRSVRSTSVESVMKHFFLEHPPLYNGNNSQKQSIDTGSKDVQCEEALLEAFQK